MTIVPDQNVCSLSNLLFQEYFEDFMQFSVHFKSSFLCCCSTQAASHWSTALGTVLVFREVPATARFIFLWISFAEDKGEQSEGLVAIHVHAYVLLETLKQFQQNVQFLSKKKGKIVDKLGSKVRIHPFWIFLAKAALYVMSIICTQKSIMDFH